MEHDDFRHRAEQPLDTVSEYPRRRNLAAKLTGPLLVATVLCALTLIAQYKIHIFSPDVRVNLFFILLVGVFLFWGLHLYFETNG